MRLFNDNSADLNKGGNLSLGFGGADDGAGSNATYPYAKNDVTIPVPASLLIGDTLPALTYATGEIPKRTLVNATHKVTIPFPGLIRSTSTVGPTNGAPSATAGHGFLIKSYTVYYRVNTSDLTSITGVLLTTPLAAGAGLPTVTTVTTTVSGGTLTQAANVYALLVTVTTPAWVTVDNTLIWGLATIVVPTNTCDLLGASWQVAMALY